MRLILAGFIILFALALSGCSGKFWAGTGTGVVATGAGYELRARQQMEKLKEDRAANRISQEEYEIRKSQIEKGSIFY